MVLNCYRKLVILKNQGVWGMSEQSYRLGLDDDDEFEMFFNPPPHKLRLDAFRELMAGPVQ